MSVYSVSGFTAATASATDAVFGLWNPDGAQRITVLEAGFYVNEITSARMCIRRTSARGTAGSTVTPDADNNWSGQDVPPSGALLDLAAYSVQPTNAGILHGIRKSATTGSAGVGHVFNFTYGGVTIPPGRGIVVRNLDAFVAGPVECYVVWEEG